MMSTVFLYVAVGVLMPLLARSIDPPSLPHTGVQLYGGHFNISYPNNSMIPANHFHRDDPNSDGLNDALWCQSAKNDPNIGVWYYPSGTQVSTVDDSSPLHSVHKSGQIGLYRDYGLNNLEGIYTCVIPDEHNINQTLTIALYKLYTYKFNRGPKIIETTFKSLLSTRDDSSFLISFNVTDGTATYINCTLNDTLIYPNITQIILSYQLPIKILVELLFQSRDEGWYNCSVSNSRVDDQYYNDINQAYPAYNNIYVKVARKPENVTAMWINSSHVLITWSPPVNENPLIDGYEVFYGVNDCDCKTISVGVTKYIEVILSGLCNIQNYSFFVVSYSNEEYALPSEWSDVTILNKETMINSQSIDGNCREHSQVLSTWLTIGVVFLLFTNLITIIVLIISCLWLQRRKYEKFDVMNPQREYKGQYLSSRDGTTVENELNEDNLHLRDNDNYEDINSYALPVYAVVDKKEDGTTAESVTNYESVQLRDNNDKEDINPHASHVYAVVNKKKKNNESKPAQSLQNITPPIYSIATAAEKNDDEMKVQLSGSNYVNVKKE